MSDALTYEDLYELLRIEKADADLMPLTTKALDSVKAYLESKGALLSKQKKANSFFNPKKNENLRSEIANAKRVLKDLFETRERKILHTALFSARSEAKIKDTTNMLDSEIELYNRLVHTLTNHHEEFFQYFTSEGVNVSQVQENQESEPENEEQKALKDENQTTTNNIMVQFKENVPPLTDLNLNKLGPFEKEDIASIPKEIADILVKDNKAEVMER